MKNKKYWLLISGLVLFFLLVTVLVIFDKTTLFDRSMYELIRSVECEFFDKYFVFITKFGNILTVIFMVILLSLIFRNKHSFMFMVLTVNSAVTNVVVKHIIQRPRPDVLKLITQGGYSYPSGHSMIAVSLYGYLLYLAFTKIKNKFLKWFFSILLIVLILSIGISRIYVGVHYASDVIAGFIFALIELLLLVNFSSKRFRGN